MITVVNRDSYSGPGINIRRRTIFGNPYVIGKDGDRDEVCDKHRVFLWECMNNGSTLGEEIDKLARRHLAGETLILVCCCMPLRCHGQTIARAIEWKASQLKGIT